MIRQNIYSGLHHGYYVIVETSEGITAYAFFWKATDADNWMPFGMINGHESHCMNRGAINDGTCPLCSI
jgi:hypothetical protein